MADLEVHPLVVVREHNGEAWSAFPAVAPALVAYATDRESALEELEVFLSEYWKRAEVSEMPRFVLPERAELREIPVVLTREDLPKSGRLQTAVSFWAVVLEAAHGARWVLIPQLSHVAYVHADRVDALAQEVEREVQRVTAAGELDGAKVLDLLPPADVELDRPRIDVAVERTSERTAHKERVLEERRVAARKLLEKVGRRVEADGAQVLHRDVNVASLSRLLVGTARNSLVLIGRRGAGKTAVFRAALARLERDGRVVYATSGAELVAGQSGLGQLEERVEQVMQAVHLLDAVLYFDGFDDLFAGTPGGHEDIAPLLRRHVARGRVRIVGELEPEQCDRLEHSYVGLFSHLQRVFIEPLGRIETVNVLKSAARSARARRALALSDAAASTVVDLVERYDPYRALPGKAIELARDIAFSAERSGAPDALADLEPDDVFRAMSLRTGVPEFLLREERGLLLADVERFFHGRLIGQDVAVRHVAEALCMIKAGLGSASKPLAVFLFIGPTGVGKTELAKALAQFLFGDPARLARFDMSEYGDPFAAERLIRGTERDDGVLTRRIREQPFSVVLLDEIEKADTAVFDLLLQVCGEGRLSDARGKVAYFHNAIIIMTSNLGARHRRAGVGFGDVEFNDRAHYLRQVREHFRPELVNRIDRIVCFEALDRQQIHRVARINIERIATREGFDGRGVRLAVSEAATALLAEAGYSTAYGARGLRRYLDQALVAPIASLLSKLGDKARGGLLVVRTAAEAESARRESSSVEDELGRLASGGLVLTAIRQRSDRPTHDLATVVGVSELRRQVRRWIELQPILELRQRLQEITAELNRPKRSKGRKLHPLDGAALSALGAEHGRLSALVTPLDRACEDLEAVEGLMIGALSEGAEPKLLEAEARDAHERFQRGLVGALLGRVDENEITLIVHELDDKRVLSDLVVPLVESVAARGWRAEMHVDRGARTPEDAWPSVEKRRWGPPMTVARYLDEYRAGRERPFRSVMIRVRGHAAGALLSLAAGRFRYHQSVGFGEVWVVVASGRFNVTDEDWDRPEYAAAFEEAVGKKQRLFLELADDDDRLDTTPGRKFWDIQPRELFARWEEIALEQVVAHARSGEPYLPAPAGDA